MAHEQAITASNTALPVEAAPAAHVQLTTDAPKNWRPVIAVGFVILLGFFGGFGGWAAYAPLGTGAIAVGQVQVAGKQKMVQSKDGGIIAALHVRDGDVVSAGQVLLELDSTETQVEVSVLSGQLWALLARRARLDAERLNSPVPKFPAELLAERDNPEVVKLIESERRLFDKRRAAMTSQVALLDQRVAKIDREIAAHRAEQKADRRQLVLIEEEIAAVRVLLEKGLERKPRLWPCNVNKPVWTGVSATAWPSSRAPNRRSARLSFKPLASPKTPKPRLKPIWVKRASKSPRLRSACAARASAWSGAWCARPPMVRSSGRVFTPSAG